MGYEIVRRQTTFWELLGQDGQRDRIHFHGKEEFGFVEPSVSSYFIVDDHPLLVDYHHSWERINVDGPVTSDEQVLAELTTSIEVLTEGWRPAANYFNNYGCDRILRQGWGVLIVAPIPISETCRAVLSGAGASFSAFPDRSARWPRRAFIAGRNYVVARSFRLEPCN